MSRKTTTTGQARFAGANWDSDNMTVRLRSNGDRVKRKVLTRGVTCITLNEGTFRDIMHYLRFGNEVRLMFPGMLDAIRLFPCMDQKREKMSVIAQTMGDFREVLADKKVRLVHKGKEVSRKYLGEMEKHAREMRLGQYARAVERAYVTPDTVVECPKCGFEFRVGRPNKE